MAYKRVLFKRKKGALIVYEGKLGWLRDAIEINYVF